MKVKIYILYDNIQVFKEAEKEVDKNNIINKLFIGYYEKIVNSQSNKPNYQITPKTFTLFNLEKICNCCRNKE